MALLDQVLEPYEATKVPDGRSASHPLTIAVLRAVLVSQTPVTHSTPDGSRR